MPKKRSFLLDKADPESTIQHVDPLGIFDLETFLKNASDLWVYPDCRGFHSTFITGFCSYEEYACHHGDISLAILEAPGGGI